MQRLTRRNLAAACKPASIAAQPCRIPSFRAPEVAAKCPHPPAAPEGMSGKVAACMPIRDEVNAVLMKRRGYLHG